MIKLLTNEFTKNLKLMFRNWASLSLLIIAPLILILLVGYAFSNEQVTGINIGVITNQEMNLEPLMENISTYGKLVQYNTAEDCIQDLTHREAHICLELKGSTFDNKPPTLEGLPQGHITYYYDNTRKKVSLAIIQNIQDYLGLTAEQISIESAETVIENIQSLVLYIEERKGEILAIKNESIKMKKDLIERKQKLVQIREEFLPSYNAIKTTQTSLHNYRGELKSASDELNTSLADLSKAIENLRKQNLTLINYTTEKTNITDENGTTIIILTNKTIETPLSPFLENLQSQLLRTRLALTGTQNNIDNAVGQIDTLVENIDTIKKFLDEEITRNDEYIIKIDESVKKIDEISTELDQKLTTFKTLDPETAKKIVKPVSYEYKMVLPEAKNIQIAFPQLLIMIILFIAILFSNIATIMEIHSKAYQRNIIAPVDDLLYVFGLLITGIILVYLQIFVLFIVAQTKFAVPIFSMFAKISLISIILITIFILIGMIIAYLFRNIQSSILVTTFSALILFLFSGALAPIETMPVYAKILTAYNPLTIGEYLTTQALLYKTPLLSLLPQLTILIGYIVLLFIILISIAKKRNKNRE